MPPGRTPPKSIDEYIAAFSPEVQAILEQVRLAISNAAPGAQETISYQIPTFTLCGALVYFAAFKNHIGFYPPVKGDPRLEKMTSRYAGEKGNLRFPLDQPIPYDLIERIVKLRVKQNSAKAAAKGKKGEKGTVPGFSVKPLDEATWPDFARLIERHNGVWGGCWCMAFHPEGVGRTKTVAQNRSEKECRVREGRAHAALVYDGATCVGWCQFGPPDELPRIKNQRAYREGLTVLPDWRITCFFVDKTYRGKGVASAALKGALQEIAHLGGGTVESYPEGVEGRSVAGSFLHNGAVSMFERQGFERIRRLGKNHWVVAKVVPRRG